MTIWKNIHTDPPTPGVGIRVTDGQSVFVGQIVTSDIPNRTWFMGTCLDDGAQICISPDDLTEWMPLPTPQEPKTLEDLGYVKRELAEEGVDWFEKEPYVIHRLDGIIYKTKRGFGKTGFKEDEILALARMIEEEQK